jgi:hypothetical protein
LGGKVFNFTKAFKFRKFRKIREMLADENGTAWVVQIPACICTICGIGFGCCGWSSIIYDFCDFILNIISCIGSLIRM